MTQFGDPITLTDFGMHSDCMLPVGLNAVVQHDQGAIDSYVQSTLDPTLYGSFRSFDAGIQWCQNVNNDGTFRSDRILNILNNSAVVGKDFQVNLGDPPLSATPGGHNGSPTLPDGSSAWSDYGGNPNPPNIAALSAYATWYAENFGAQTTWYEFGNELNDNIAYWNGTAQQWVDCWNAVVNAVKSQSEASQFILPAVSPLKDNQPKVYLQDILDLGAGSSANAIAVHSYCAQPDYQPEAILTAIAETRAVLTQYDLADLPIFLEETGVLAYIDGNGDVAQTEISSIRAAGFACRSVLCALLGGAQRVYWYAWDFKYTKAHFTLETDHATLMGAGLGWKWCVQSMVGGKRGTITSEVINGVTIYTATFQNAQLETIVAIWCNGYEYGNKNLPITVRFKQNNVARLYDSIGNEQNVVPLYPITDSPLFFVLKKDSDMSGIDFFEKQREQIITELMDSVLLTIDPIVSAIANIGGYPSTTNLFRPTQIISDQNIYLPQGGIENQNGYFLSEVMVATPGDYSVSRACHWRSLKADGETVIGSGSIDEGGSSFTAPAGTRLIQISSDNSALSGQPPLMLVRGDTIPLVYIAPGWEDPATSHRAIAQITALQESAERDNSRSMIVLANITKRMALDQSNGNGYNINGYALTDIIPVISGVTYSMSSERLVAFFDADRNFLRVQNLNTTFIVPNNVCGIRIQLYANDLGVFHLGRGSIAPTRRFENDCDRSNIINPSNIAHNEGIDGAGNSFALDGWARSGKVSVKSGDFLAISGNTNTIAWYDSSGAGLPTPYNWEGQGSISNGVLTIDSMTQGRVLIGSRVTYNGLANELYIVPGGNGQGSTGTYVLSSPQNANIADQLETTISCGGAALDSNVWAEVPPDAAFAQWQSYGAYSLDYATAKIASWGQVVGENASALVGFIPYKTDPNTMPFYGQPIAIIGNSQVENGLFQDSMCRVNGLAKVLNNGNPGKDIGYLADTVIPAIATSTYKLGSAKHVIFVEGHNEWGGAGRPLGTLADDSSINSTVGKLRKAIESLFSIDPEITLTIVGPTYRAAAMISGVTYPADSTPNAQGVTGEQINATMQAVAQAEGVNFCDIRHLCSFNSISILHLTAEGLHWSMPIGAPRVGRAIGASLVRAG